MRGSRSVFWGIMLLLVALALLVGRLGYLDGVGIWPILFSIFLAAAFVRGFIRRSFAEILFSAAFFIIVNDELLGLEAITPWPVLGAALLGSIGLGLLFPQFSRRHGHIPDARNRHRGMVDEVRRNGDLISYENVFGNSVKYVSGEVGRVTVENCFGCMQLYFMDAWLRDGQATVRLENAFGKTTIYMPSSWAAELNVENCFGASHENGRCEPDGFNVLRVEGEVCFGELEVVYVESRQALETGKSEADEDLTKI